MSLYVKNSDVWKKSIPWVKVSGTWRRTKQYAKVGTTWKLIYGIPSGLIIMSADGTTPTGWSRFTGADGRYIVGAGYTYSVGATGGAASINDSGLSYNDGAHNGHGSVSALTGGATYHYMHNDVAGLHHHQVDVQYTPSIQNMVLIKAGADMVEVPANGMFFGVTTPSGFSVFNSSSYLMGQSSISEVAATGNATCYETGSHSHTLDYATTGTGHTEADFAGTHNHNLANAAIYENFKKAVLRGLYKASTYGLEPGLIGMWEGATAPLGWHLCDGTGGTVDLRDHYIMFSTTGDGTLSGTINSVAVGMDLLTDSWSHSHNTSTMGFDTFVDAIDYFNTLSVSHSHTFNQTFTYTPIYYALTFIQYTGSI